MYNMVVTRHQLLCVHWFNQTVRVAVDAVVDDDDGGPVHALSVVGLSTRIAVGGTLTDRGHLYGTTSGAFIPPFRVWQNAAAAAARGVRFVTDDVVRRLHRGLTSHVAGRPWTCHGVLLTGVTGVGKSHAVSAVAKSSGLPVHRVTGADMIRTLSGDSESYVQRVWLAAERTAPSLVVIDDLHAVLPAKSASPMQSRLCRAVLHCMDDLRRRAVPVFVLATTAHARDVLPRALSPGRVDVRVDVRPPTAVERGQLLARFAEPHVIAPDALEWAASATSTCVAADLQALCREAVLAAVLPPLTGGGRRETGGRSGAFSADGAGAGAGAGADSPPRVDVTGSAPLTSYGATHSPSQSLPPDAPHAVRLTQAHLQLGLANIKPSAAVHSVGSAPPAGAVLATLQGLDDVTALVLAAVEQGLLHPDAYTQHGIAPPRGLVLHGPSGTGKTHLAHAVANALKGRVGTLCVRCPDVVSMIVGETEAAIAALFAAARESAPCLLVFDQFESLAPARHVAGRGGAVTFDRLLSVLLVEMDGVMSRADDRRGVFVLATCTDKDDLDAAMLRPG